MPRAQLRIHAAGESEDAVASISTELPDAEFRILASHTNDDGLLGIAEVATTEEEALVRLFAEHPDVDSFEIFHSDDRSVLVKYVVSIPVSYREVLRTGNLPRFPAMMRDGWLHIEQTTTQEAISRYADALDSAGITFEIKSLIQSPVTDKILTERQREFVTEAVNRGYYDDPRRCTLTELAEAFDVNSSAASGVLHRAEGRIVKEILNTTEENDPDV